MVRFHQFVKACFLLFVFVLGLLLLVFVLLVVVLVVDVLVYLALALGLGLGLGLWLVLVVEPDELLVEPVVLEFEVLGVAVARLGVVVVSVQLKLL